MSTHVRTVARAMGALVAPLALVGALVFTGGAASASAPLSRVPHNEATFCKILLTDHPTQPSSTSFTTFRAWARANLPFYEKLAAAAPNATVKDVLGEMVAIIKADANATSVKGLSAYMAAHLAKWVSGWKALAKALTSCVSVGIGSVG
jgi:hypothetical protein